jgi:hypothetical protein
MAFGPGFFGTGHRSVQTVMGYYQSGEVSTSKAARLMEGDSENPKRHGVTGRTERK